MQRLAILVFAVLTALSTINAYAAPGNTSKPDANSAVVATTANFDADKATRAWLDTLSPTARAKSDAYFEGGYWLILWDFVVATLIAWLVLSTRLSAGMRDLGERIAAVPWLQVIFFAVQCLALLVVLPLTLLLMIFGKDFRVRMFKLPGSTDGFKWPQGLLYFVQYLFITAVVQLPWDAYEGYFREHQYGMSNQDMGGFMGDWVKGLVLNMVFISIALIIVYAVIRRAQRTWWLWGSLAGLTVLLFTVAIGPTYLEPVFNKFYPLPESPLKEQILSLARANAIPATDVYEFDASKQTKRMSAHVSGFLGTTQISMNDNLMNRASPEEIKAVLGHEMGHYVMNHVYKGILEFGLLIVIGFAFMQRSFGWVQRRYGAKWGIRDVTDVAAVPVLMILISTYFFVLTPVNNSLTRAQEAEADAFGLNAARQPDGFAQGAIHLSEYRKMEPGTLEEIFFYDHPSGYHRIHRAMVWKAEHINDPDIVAYDAAHPKIEMPPGEQR